MNCLVIQYGSDHLILMRVRAGQEDVFRPGYCFRPRHDPVFLYAYNA